jgi:hypothetical protein
MEVARVRESADELGFWPGTMDLEEDVVSAERGWIGDPQPARQWHDSHYSREADRIAARDRGKTPVTGDETHD